MSTKRILVFAPYGSWGVHHQLDAVISAALRERGCEVLTLGCDGVFEQCFIAGKPPNPETCRQCSDAGKRLFGNIGLPLAQIRAMLAPADLQAASAWAESIPADALADAVFEGSPLGEWVSSSVHSYFLTGNLDFSRPDVASMYRRQLRNGAVIQRAFTKVLDAFKPDHVFSYNSLHSYYRVAFELARKRGIPVLVHERGLVDDTFLVLPNATPNHYRPRWDAWETWKNVPIDAAGCEKVRAYFEDREAGKNTNNQAFYSFSSEAADVRRHFRIPDNGRIVAVFPSTEREIGSIKGLIRGGFDTQVEWLRKTVELISQDDIYLIIRHHPNNTAKGVVDHDFIKVMAELSLEFPDKVRVAMPYEKITSYAILRNAEALVTFFSTTEAEAIMRGVPVVCVAESVYIPMGVDYLTDKAEYPAAIARLFEKSRRMGIAELRQAYRFAYYLFFKLNFRFKHVGIKNIHEMDIRFRDFKELLPGTDPALDRVCAHIMDAGPLYPPPTAAEAAASDREETAFLEAQLESISRKRVPPSAPKSRPAEPLINVIAVKDGSGPGEGKPLSLSLRRSRHKRIQSLELAIPAGSGVKGLIAGLRDAVTRSTGEFVYVVPENVHVDEAVLSASVDLFRQGDEDQTNAVIWGAWRADASGNIKEAFLTESNVPVDFDAALKANPAWSDPFQLLAHFVMRRSFLESVCDYLDVFQIGSAEEISAMLFDAFYLTSKDGGGIIKTGLPMLILHPPRSPRAGESEATMTNATDPEALRNELIHHANVLEKDPYQRVSILASARLLKQVGDDEGAVSVLSHYLGRFPEDAEILGLSRDWGRKGAAMPAAAASGNGASASGGMRIQSATATLVPKTQEARTAEKPAWTAAPGNPFAGEKVYATYAEAQPLVETVSGWLLEGQEKFLFDAAKAVPEGGHILEMGADRGRSTTAMGLACSGSDKRIFSIDTFCGNDGIMGKTYDFYHEWHGNLKRVGVDKHCEGIKGLTFDVLPGWGSRPMLDFVFIDASHEYIDVLKDFRLIYPHVKPGGMIAFHDVEPGWPGPWRVWLEHAVPLLTDHRQVATLTCGRKVAGRDFDWVKRQSGFSFAAHWIDDLARTYGDGGELFNAMRASLAFAKAPESDRARILQQEQIIMRMPEPLEKTLTCMLGKDAFMDGHLHHWNGMILMGQGKREEARAEFMEALKVSYPVHPAQAGHYLAQLGGARADAPGFGVQQGTASGPVAAPANGHYGKEYFDWQKQIGAFGGTANLFKFRDHVKDSDTVIDFGSGGGYLLRNLPGRVKLGVEINEVARKEASLKAGIDAFESAAELPDGCADVIVSNHALEHVHGPLEALRLLRRKLKPGGKMVCVVPHEGPQIAYDPNDVNKHLYTWNPMTLGNLFEAAGFEGISAENIQHQWPPDFIKIWETAGEAEFHRLSREHAQRNGTFQVRVVAFAGRDVSAAGAAQRKADMAAQMADSARSAGYSDLKKPIALDDIPVALIAYKRHEHTSKVLRSLKEAGIRNIHVFCDGAKGPADAEGVEKTRKLCRSIDWARPVMHESGENRGLAKSIMSAVDGLLEANETLILLEDDCVPQKHFFDFMRKSLNKYRDAEEVFGISGYTVNIPEPLLAKYPHDAYFLSRIGSWGWATWKRAWAKLERDLPKATREAVARGINLSQGGSDIPVSLNGILQGTVKDVWTLNWLLTVYLNRGYFVYPTVSHIDNIGMDGTGVHCGATDRYATRLSDREPTRFPDGVILDADLIVNFRKYYDL